MSKPDIAKRGVENRGTSDPHTTNRGIDGFQALREAKDFSSANSYVTDFYQSYLEIYNQFVLSIHLSVNSFSETSKVSSNDKQAILNTAYQLIRVVLAVLPASNAVVNLFDKMSSGLGLALNGKNLANITGTVAQRMTAGIYTAAAGPDNIETTEYVLEELDDLGKFSSKGKSEILKERDVMREYVAQLSNDINYKNRILLKVRTALGPIPTLDPEFMELFKKRFELSLYREYYKPKVTIIIYISSMWGEHGREILHMPEAVQARISKLANRHTLEEVLEWGVGVKTQQTSGKPY